jgi:short-subunit dehydrogenase involved in D-alanine esterification of teichoic acids
MLKDISHAGLKVVVTAGASGIGLTIAQGFLDAGAQVFICDANEAALAEALGAQATLKGCVADVGSGRCQGHDYSGATSDGRHRCAGQ